MANDKHLIGWDFAEQCRKVGEALEREHEESRWRNDGGEHLYDKIVVPVTTHMDLHRGLWVATMVDSMPLVGKLSAFGRNSQHAANEIRSRIAWEMHQKMGVSFDEARKHCTRYAITVES